MSQMEINRVLAQIRSMSQATKAGALGGIGGAGPAGAKGVAGVDNGFAKILKQGLDSVNATLTPSFTINHELDNPNHPVHIYERSDHYSYAKYGIPIVFLTTGEHGDYHKVTDDPRKIEYAKMARVTRLMVELGRAVANSDRRPR